MPMPSIPESESLVTEFKAEWNDEKDGGSIMRTLVAFANTAGGDLYIGVNDDGSIAGLSDPGSVEEKLASAVRDSISPSLAGCLVTERLEISGKTVLRVHVDRGPGRPYCLDPKTASGVYIRVGSTSSPASMDDIARMVMESNPVPFESRIAFEQDLTFTNCLEFCEKHGLRFDPKSNRGFGFWDPVRRAWTNLAYLCSDQSDSAEVLVAFEDDEKVGILEGHRIEGGIFRLFEEAYAFIGKYNYARLEKPNDGRLGRINHYFVDPRAVLEALVSMIAHRDYSKRPAGLIHVTPSKFEISALGRLAEGLCADDIVFRMSAECRNRKLAHLLQSLGLMEDCGSGFRYIRECFRETDLQDLLHVTGTSFTITLPVRKQAILFRKAPPFPQEEPADSKARAVLDYLKEHSEATRSDVQRLLGISQTSAVVLLKSLLDRRLIERLGATRSIRYRLKDSAG